MRLRTAYPTDYDAIVAVVDHWWGREVAGSLPRLFLDHFWPTSVVAEDDTGLAGFLIGFVSPADPRIAYLHFVAVRPDARRTGLAGILHATFARTAIQAGCREMHAITAPQNTASIDFHRRLGFEISDPVPDYNGPGRPMVAMWRALQA